MDLQKVTINDCRNLAKAAEISFVSLVMQRNIYHKRHIDALRSSILESLPDQIRLKQDFRKVGIRTI